MYDPFTGTGSILLAATYFGAYTWGGDMDIRVIRDGRNGKTNWTNFTTYNMQHPLALIRCDNHAPPFRKGEPDILIFIYNTSMYTLVGNCRTSCYN